jgi:hypothetical protein
VSDDRPVINVFDPVYREEVLVTRGSRGLYFVKYDDDTKYAIMDDHGNGTVHTWRGEIDGISDFIALHDIFDDVYPDEAGGDS